MSTNLPPDAYTKEVVAWWDTLNDQERIVAASRAAELVGGLRTLFFKVAENPGVWALEAHELRDVPYHEPM